MIEDIIKITNYVTRQGFQASRLGGQLFLAQSLYFYLQHMNSVSENNFIF